MLVLERVRSSLTGTREESGWALHNPHAVALFFTFFFKSVGACNTLVLQHYDLGGANLSCHGAGVGVP
jgi:hypothetical protein